MTAAVLDAMSNAVAMLADAGYFGPADELAHEMAKLRELIEAVGDVYGTSKARCNSPCMSCRITRALASLAGAP